MISFWTWHFDLEDEARAFLASEKESLAKSRDYDYVDSDVSYSEEWDAWVLRIDYSQHGPEAA